MNAVPETLLIEKMRAKYEAFGVPVALIPNSGTTHAKLLRILEAIEPRIPDVPCQLVPTSFDPDDSELRALPRALNWRWMSCETMLRTFGTTGIMMRLPLFWQVELALFAVGEAIGAPIFVNDQGNMPVGAAAIRTAHMDTAVTDTEDASTFSSYLSEAKTQLPAAWLIVHPVSLDGWDIPSALRDSTAHVAQEVHVFPGVPFLEQCSFLATNKETRFHVCTGYFLETAEGVSCLTGREEDPLPLLRYQLPYTLVDGELCSCGKSIIARAR